MSDDPPPESAELTRLTRLAAERARERDHALEELDVLTSVVNHHLRSPLVSLMGFSAELDHLRREAFERWRSHGPADTERDRLETEMGEAQEYLQAGVRQLAMYIESLSKLGAERRLVLTPRPVDTTELVDEVCAARRAEVAPGTLEVTSLPRLNTDPDALRRLVTALVDNAVRFRRPDVPLQLVISAEATPDAWLFHLRDNGRGLAAGDERRVFRPFVQGTPVLSPRPGLGLAIARSLARRLGGELSVSSTLGQGSDFVLELPAR